MRRSASEIIRNLEMRVARLEKSSGQKTMRLINVIESIERYHRIEILSDYNKRDLGTKVYAPHPNDIRKAISRKKKIRLDAVGSSVYYMLNWRDE